MTPFHSTPAHLILLLYFFKPVFVHANIYYYYWNLLESIQDERHSSTFGKLIPKQELTLSNREIHSCVISNFILRIIFKY